MGDCRKIFRLRRISAGFTMIEVMIAGGLIAFIAVALLPAIFSVMDTSKSSGFKGVCSGAVRAKLQEYLNGVADNTVDGNGYVPTGFEYTKRRYQMYGYSTCTLTSSAGPGFREDVYGNGVELGGAGATEWIPGSHHQVAVMQGFQLWVKIRRYNPRKLMFNGTVDTTGLRGVPDRDCPWQYYQFYSLGDALEVTVTGMARTDGGIASGGRNGAGVGKLFDVGHPVGTAPNPLLTCSATELVYPPRLPFRYYLGGDGKIRNYQSAIAFNNGNSIQSSLQAMEAHYRNIWVSPSVPPNALLDQSVNLATPRANIRSFAVSPDNQWVYVLRPGELARYGPCYDTGTVAVKMPTGPDQYPGGDVTVNLNGLASTAVTYKGTPDCPTVPSISTYTYPATGPDGKVWVLNPNIENIAVDFGKNLDDPADDKVYAMYNSSSTFGSGSSGVLIATTLHTAPDGGGKYQIDWAESGDFTLPASAPRIRGMYITQLFPASATNVPNLFFFDNTCYAATGASVNASTYCASIFSSKDTNQTQVVRELPNQIEGISY